MNETEERVFVAVFAAAFVAAVERDQHANGRPLAELAARGRDMYADEAAAVAASALDGLRAVSAVALSAIASRDEP